MVPSGTVEILEVPVEADLADVSRLGAIVPIPLVSVFSLDRQVVGHGEFGTNADRNVSTGSRVGTNAEVSVDQSSVGDEAETARHVTLPGRVRQPGNFTFEAGEQRVVEEDVDAEVGTDAENGRGGLAGNEETGVRAFPIK